MGILSFIRQKTSPTSLSAEMCGDDAPKTASVRQCLHEDPSSCLLPILFISASLFILGSVSIKHNRPPPVTSPTRFSSQRLYQAMAKERGSNHVCPRLRSQFELPLSACMNKERKASVAGETRPVTRGIPAHFKRIHRCERGGGGA